MGRLSWSHALAQQRPVTLSAPKTKRVADVQASNYQQEKKKGNIFHVVETSSEGAVFLPSKEKVHLD